MAAGTVNVLSSGRFRLGLGSSHRVQVQAEHGFAYAVTGRIEECRSKIDEMTKAGIKLPILFYHSLNEDREAELEAFIRTIA